MNQLGARSQTWTSRWSSVLLVAVVGMVAALSAVIVASVRGVSITITVGSQLPYGPVVQATGGLRRGWPPAVLVRARGPPG